MSSIELTPTSRVTDWHSGIGEMNLVTVDTDGQPPVKVPWGSVIAHTHGAVLDQLPDLGVKAWLPDLIKAGEGDEKATERLRHYWTHGEGGTVKVRWGEPGDFDRCVRHVGKYMENPEGYCAERHHDALGIWPATHAKEERDAKKATGTPGLTKRSGMVSLDLPEGTVPLHPSGVDDHHITLAYLGSNVSDAELEAALNLVRAAAPNHEPLTIRLGGVASFPPSDSSDGLVPAYVPVVKSRELASLREDLSSLSRSEHTDWHPHVTLAFLNEGDPLPAPAPVTEFQAAHISVHHGGRVWRVPLGEAAVKKAYGVSFTPGGFIPKVGPEGYIHGFICVRPPCGKGDHAKVTRDPSNGKVYLGEKGTGEYIGKIVKNSDGTYTARHNGAIIGGGKTLLGGKYADHQKAAVALGQYHSLRAMEKTAHDQGQHETASHLGSAATMHASGDAEQAVFSLHQAHQSSKAGTDLSHHISLLHQGMGGKPAEFPQHPTSDAELESALKPAWEEIGIPKPAAPVGTPTKNYTDVGTVNENAIEAEFTDGQGTLVHAPTGALIGTYTAHNGNIQIKHADGETVPYNTGDSIKAAIAKYHNEWHGHEEPEPVPIKEMTEVHEPAIMAPPAPSGPKPAWHTPQPVDVKDLSLKANGDVVHKPTKTVIGHVDKQADTPKPGTSTFTAYHADGSKTHTGVYKGNAMASIALHHNEQLGKPSAPVPAAPTPAPEWTKAGHVGPIHEGNVYTKLGKNGTIDVYHNGTNTKIGEYHALGLSDVIARHADNTTLGSHSSGTEAMQAIIDYHNQKIDELGSPTSSAATPAPSAPSLWHQAGKAVRPEDVTIKQNGDVVHKGTKQKIGVVYKTQGNYYTAAHEDGQGFGKYNKKADAINNLVTYQNQATAIRDGVEEDDPTFTASETLPPGMFYAAKKNEYGDYVNQNGTYYGRLEADPAGGYTAALANGAQFHIAAPDETSAKYKLLYAHNQAVNVAKGMKETKPAVHPPLEGQTIGFSPHTSVGLAPIKSASTSVHGLSVPTGAMAVKHELVTPHTGAETAAVKKYTSSWYAAINSKIAKQKLLGDQVPDDASGKALHHALNKTELAHDVTLHRGIHDAVGMLGPVGSKVGKVDIQHSFMSTSTKPSVAQGFGHGGVLLTVHAPKGAKAMNVVNLSHYHSEAEVLFQHGTMYRVNSDVMGPDGVRRADITIVGLSSSTGNHTVYNQVGAK